MTARISAIEYILPECIVTNEQLALEYPEWTVKKIYEKTGIMNRHIAAPDEFASDLAVKAAERLFSSGAVNREKIDFLLFCTQSPDYRLPTTACIIQERLCIPKTCGALDYNLGCSGFVYGLALAKGMIETGSAHNVLLLTAETYSKYINPGDRSVRTIFGDAAAATLVVEDDFNVDLIGPFVFGTDGSGAKNLIVPAGGARRPTNSKTAIEHRDESGCIRSENDLYMNGTEIFTFTLRSVSAAIDALLAKTGNILEDVDLFVFHQANKFMLDTLRVKCKIPEGKFVIAMRDIGNTVSATIPIALKEVLDSGRLQKGMRVLLVGFGVGYSWAACMIEWQ
jgi:3-oxoacyl-[acyl-carrier-protein] synthase III